MKTKPLKTKEVKEPKKPKLRGKPAFEAAPGGQTAALSSIADELLIGSVLGCGKSLLLLMMPVRYLHLKFFNCLILRSSFAELENGLIKMSHNFYPQLGGVYNQTRHEWIFPSGAQIGFGFLEGMEDIQRYRGIEKQMICYDELSSFSGDVYNMMNLWLRTAHECYPLKIISTSNPGGKYGDWILEKWKPWLSHSAPFRLKSGDVAEINGKLRACVVLKPEDNPYINRIEYDRQFEGLPEYIVRQLRDGNWDVRPSSGEYFKRQFIEAIYSAPQGQRHRGWDFASSVSKTADYTASVLLNKANGSYVIEDYFRYKLNTAGVEALLLKTAQKDGTSVKQIISVDPGQAGESQKMHIAKLLNGYHFEFVKDLRKKVERAKPVSSQVLSKMVSILFIKEFYEPFMQELEAFTDNEKDYLHDDWVDALSICFNSMLKQRAVYRDIPYNGPKWFGSDDEDF